MSDTDVAEKKVLTIREVSAEDAELLTEVAKTLDITNAMLLHHLLAVFRSKEGAAALAHLRAMREAQKAGTAAAVETLVSGQAPRIQITWPQGEKPGKYQLDGNVKLDGSFKILDPDKFAHQPLTSGAAIGTMSAILNAFGRCPKCGGQTAGGTAASGWITTCPSCKWSSDRPYFQTGSGGR